MTKQLVLIHGRAQQNLDPTDLKKFWVDSWKAGLNKNGLDIPLADEDIRFPFYGDALADLVSGKQGDEIADVIVKGENAGEAEREFIRSIILETQNHLKIGDEQVEAVSDAIVTEKGILNWKWVRNVLQAIDYYVPYASSTGISLATRDVYLYLKNPGFQNVVDAGVRSAFDAKRETVVVGHSLGSVAAYSLLRREGEALGWKVPLFVTVGSPLAVTAIKNALHPSKAPACVDKWFNAMDSRDIVALYPLDSTNYPDAQPIDNKTDVNNETPNRHGILGYLSDPVVAKRIYDAVIT